MRDQTTIARDSGTECANAHWVRRLVSGHGQKHLDLFSGIGGFALAAQAAGYETIAFSEIEPYACKILKQTWPTIPNLGDIRNIRGIRADLITGGFPCQPFSHAGKRRGASDDRALWPEMCRVIAEAQPSWVLGENVAGIISMELDRVLSDLENLGYSAWPIVIPACAVGAPHRRDRVWILANRDGGSGSAEHGQQQTERPALSGAGSGGNVADAERRGQPRPGKYVSALYPAAGSDGETTGSFDGSRPAIWQPEPGMGRVANGIPNRTHRLRGLGNAIVPQVAEIILCNLARMTANAPHEPRRE